MKTLEMQKAALQTIQESARKTPPKSPKADGKSG